MSTADLPALNACLNGSAAILLYLGRRSIKNGARERHRRLMLVALAVSAAFLASYLTFHAIHGSTRFSGPAPIRFVYLGILLVHTILAVVNLPLITLTLVRALKGQFQKHRAIAVWTWRSWMFVSVSGVVVYLMLYQIWAAPRADAFTEAQAVHKKGGDQAALALYRRAESEGHPGAVCFRAVLEDRLNDTETSSAAIAGVLAKHPDEPSCLALEAREMILDDHAEAALPILERAAKLAPNDGFVIATLGFGDFRNHRYQEAAADFERATAIDPDLPANVYNAGYAHFLFADYAPAKKLLERALAMKSLDSELAASAKEQLEIIDGVRWVCPMHPEVSGPPSGKCTICGMALAPAVRGIAPELGPASDAPAPGR